MTRSLSSSSSKDLDEPTSPSAASSNGVPTVLSGSTLQQDTTDVTLPPTGNVNENSPLLHPVSEEDGLMGGPVDGDELDDIRETKSLWYLILLTISIGGLQIAWSVELSTGSPYLLSLGLSKSLMALVWIAGPLTGTLVQPYVGMMSDRCRVRWGKRKPFMLGGAAATACSFMFLAWAKDIIGGLLSLFGADSDSNGVKIAIIVFAVIWVYILDFAINTVQAAIRAFIVDCAPPHQQEAANSMASRMTGVGNIIGYCAGYVHLPNYVGWLGNTQFKVLCSIASIALCLTVLVSITVIPERDPRLEGPPPKDQPGVIAFFRTIFKSIRRLPPQIKKVCEVQFCAWVGFFPMLFYTSSYIGEIYVELFLEENPHMTPEELDKLYETATQVGTFALLIFAITSLATNVFLPFFIAPTYDNSPVVSNASNGVHGDPMKKSFLEHLVIPGFTLRRAWMISHIIFALAMFCTVLVRSVTAATVLIGFVGITWALTLWAPYAIISAEIRRRDAITRTTRKALVTLPPPRNGENSRLRHRNTADDEEAEELLLDAERNAQHHKDNEEEKTDQAGVILGIHNMAIASPQIFATLGSSVIFKFTQKPRGTPGDHSFAIVLALGGIFTLGAAYIVHRISDDMSSAPMADVLAAAEEGVDNGVAALPHRRAAEGSRSSDGPGSSRKSVDEARRSIERANLARSSSFGQGLEY